jgi:hypothetical protein
LEELLNEKHIIEKRFKCPIISKKEYKEVQKVNDDLSIPI